MREKSRGDSLVNGTAIALNNATSLITPILCATLIAVAIAGITCAYKVLSNPRCTADAKKRFRKFAATNSIAGISFVISLIFSITESLTEYTYYVLITGLVIFILAFILMIPWKTPEPMDITEPMNENRQGNRQNQENRGYG